MKRILDPKKMQEFEFYLKSEERSAATIEKYMRDVRRVALFACDAEIDKQRILSVIGGFSYFVDLKLFPHLQIVSHLGGMLTLFKITVFINQRLYHSGRFLFFPTTRKSGAYPFVFSVMILVVVGKANVINVFS